MNSDRIREPPGPVTGESNSEQERHAALPDGLRIYAIGDIHGRADLLKLAFGAIDADLVNSPSAARTLHVFLGDYVDRGPDSKGVLDMLIDRGGSHETVFLKGNHEALLLDALQNPDQSQGWLGVGGRPTLASYGVVAKRQQDAEEQSGMIRAFVNALPQAHVDFLQSLRPAFSCGDFLFVHAGIRPGVPLERQTERDLYWIRDEFLSSEAGFDKYVVHGHTPVLRPDIRFNRANIDTGAYATGNLTVLSIAGNVLHLLPATNLP